MLDSRRGLLILFLAALLLQTTATIVAMLFLNLPFSTGWDNQDYIRNADNAVAAHSFSIDTAPPFPAERLSYTWAACPQHSAAPLVI